MKRRDFLIGTIASSALACAGGSRRSTSRRPPGRTEVVFEFEGRDRRSVLYVPDSAQDRAPLVIAIHGNNGDPSVMSKAHGFDKVCEAEGWIGLYPHCNLPNEADDVQGDFRFLNRLLRDIADDTRADPSRIYAVGFSGGGKKCYSLAARCSDLVSAIAVSGTRIGHRGFEDQFDPDRNQAEKVSILHIHGRKDTRIPLRGGPDPKHDREGIGMRAGLEIWAAHNGCRTDKSARPPNGCPKNIAAHGWRAPDGYRVMGLSDPSLDHSWPSWANPVVVDFLKGSPRRT